MTRAHPRRIIWLLAAATILPIAVLSWLGVRVLEQDRVAERQGRRDALNVAGLRVSVDIERRLQDLEGRLARGEGLRFSQDGIAATATAPVLYQPAAAHSPQLTSASLAEAEVLEHQRGDFRAVVSSYRLLATSGEANVRAAALVGLARVLRNVGDKDQALRTLAELEALGSVPIADQPAALVARQLRGKLFEAAGDQERLRLEAGALAKALADGRWPIDRLTFELYRDLVVAWGGQPVAGVAVARTDAAIRLWQIWRSGELPANGRRVLTGDKDAVLAIWNGDPERPAVWLMTSEELERDLQPLFTSQALRVAGRDTDGRSLFGIAQDDGVSLMPGDTRLPFILNVARLAPTADEGAPRRALLIAGLATAFALMLAASYGLYRVTSRELLLARQQRDFVSAVSHEFRTPLTSMRHLTDLLATRSVTSEERRAHYYQILAHETERLHRMVENLLSFGRIEAGAYAWHLEPTDVGALVSTIVEEFRREPAAATRDIRCDIDDSIPAIRADAEALSRAIWNLLENAAKYSDAAAPIDVSVRRAGSAVHVGVGDQGVGIQPDEQDRIFQTFVRGADATRNRIRGVGIGLALVKRIIEAHGGSVRVESKPGRGSTFTLVIPCPES